MVSTWVRRSGCAGVAAALVSLCAARAEAHGGETLPILVVGVLAPAEIGVVVSPEGSPRGLLGWSYQLSFGKDCSLVADCPHRLVLGVELLPHSGGASWQGRLGYRYAYRSLFFGAGPLVGAGGLSLSPEIGFKFLHSDRLRYIDPSLHVIARAQVAPAGFQGATFLLGWNFI